MSLAQHIAEKTRKKQANGSRARGVVADVVSKAADLLDLIEEKDRSSAVKVLRAGLRATKRVFISKKLGWGDEPDWHVRHESAMAILAYAFGKPVERQITATGSFQELSELLDRVNESPRARRIMAQVMPKEFGATNPEQQPEKLE